MGQQRVLVNLLVLALCRSVACHLLQIARRGLCIILQNVLHVLWQGEVYSVFCGASIALGWVVEVCLLLWR